MIPRRCPLRVSEHAIDRLLERWIPDGLEHWPRDHPNVRKAATIEIVSRLYSAIQIGDEPQNEQSIWKLNVRFAWEIVSLEHLVVVDYEGLVKTCLPLGTVWRPL